MTGEFKGREIPNEEKSTQEMEQELIDKHEQETTAAADVEDKENIETVDVSTTSEETGGDDTNAVEDNTEEPQQLEVTDENVLSYINNKTGNQFGSLDDIFNKKEETKDILPEDVEAFYKFKKETGRSLSDFYELNRDFSSMNDDQILKKFYSENNPSLDSEDVDFELKEKFGYDSDMDEERIIRRKTVDKKKEVAKAKEYFSKQQEQYKAPLESSEPIVPEGEREMYNEWKQSQEGASEQQAKIAKSRENFSTSTNELFSNNFEGFEFKLGDAESEKTVMYNIENVDKVKEQQMDVSNFINKHLDDNGDLVDPAAYHRALNVAMNPDAFAKHFYNLGAAEAIEGNVKDSKNIDMSPRKTNEGVKDSGFKVSAVDNDHGSGLKINMKSKN
jgi:hypothetical protein